ncbi:hypothetical protein KFK09_002347 [Dendrobium nobile]|uniref:Endonuclease/exonuclease/phosphatase domain-containing protein n=1 Tax=Dendrobium nobile TaxID=94219 RepID=A0A8T3C6U3_DENNO|nr:hypothetical protein KFK09_002347 [Dendrobium nobile]
MSSVGFWNCRGTRKRIASLYIKDFVKDNGVMFLGLLETKVSFFDRREINSLIGADWDYFQVPLEGLFGGIIVLWRSNVATFKVLETSQQFSIGDLEFFNKGIWRIGSIYASKDAYKRKILWEKLQIYSSKEKSMVIGGDFNCLLNKEDKRGGKRFSYSLGAREMELFLASNDLHEVGCVGPKFTWCNNKIGVDRILERLDRCYLNSTALCTPHRIMVKHLARIASDHCLILLNLFECKSEYKKVIRFEDMWISNPSSSALVKNIWKKKALEVYGQILNLKMKRTLKALFHWNKEKHKNLVQAKESVLREILELQENECNEGTLSDEDNWILKVKVSEFNSILAWINTW